MSAGHHHHHELDEVDETSERYKQIRNVTLVGSVVDLGLGVLKIFVGWLSHSQALVADGIHSLSDLFTDFMVLWAAKHAHADADEAHPYGHGRIETITTIALGLALFIVAFGIAWEAVERLYLPESLLVPTYWAILAAFVSVVFKEAIYRYTMWAAKKYRSTMLRANAWHSRSDAVSSIVVMIGVGGAMAGLTYLDAVAAFVVAVMIGKIAWELVWHSVQEILDAGLEEERVLEIEKLIMQVDGVLQMHMLRTRRLGPDALVDVHVLVGSHLSISEGHHIAEKVRYKVVSEVEEVTDVMVHIDPEDDELVAPCRDLPLRSSLMQDLKQSWHAIPQSNAVEGVTLHYLNGMIEVDLILPLSILTDVDHGELSRRFNDAALAVKNVRCVRVLYK
ncbi:MAG: cation transporter [Gammaproteobacteria bacterium]|nr:cation transporter [Gammaproteobacteria bacterium]